MRAALGWSRSTSSGRSASGRPDSGKCSDTQNPLNDPIPAQVTGNRGRSGIVPAPLRATTRSVGGIHRRTVILCKILEELPGFLALHRGTAQPVPGIHEELEVLRFVEIQPTGGMLDVHKIPGSVRKTHNGEVVRHRGEPCAERQDV